MTIIIGNQDYIAWNKLKTPCNDIDMVGKKLKEAGFCIELFYNLNYENMREQISRIKYFGADPNDMCLFYYAGHGFENNGDNYLVPCDAQLQAGETSDCINISDFVKIMGSNEATKLIVVLDCCRVYSNHDEHSEILKDQIKNISVSSDTYVMFSTSSGYGALDCSAKTSNSVFAKAFLEVIEEKSLYIEQLSKKVRKRVLNYSKTYNRMQLTWDYSSLVNDIIINVDIDKYYIDFSKHYSLKKMKLDEITSAVKKYCSDKNQLDQSLFLVNVFEKAGGSNNAR